MYSLTQLKPATPLFLIVLVGLGFLPVQAVVPPPDGGYPNFTTAEGTKALQNLTTGAANTAVGWYSLFSAGAANNNTAVGAAALTLNTADNNTAVGLAALFLNTSGHHNTAIGTGAIVYNDTGIYNNAVGTFALYNNISGGGNNAFGASALLENISGQLNTAVGDLALGSNDATGNGLGSYNTAVGAEALELNTDGDSNTAVGFRALESNDTGRANTAIGPYALLSNTTGSGNIATGFEALLDNTEGEDNIAYGYRALLRNTTGGDNTAYGILALSANTTGNGNTALGRNAGIGVTTANNVIAIGSSGANVSNSCFIGQIYSNIQPQVGTDPDSVTINSNGRLGRGNVSSRRYKHNIEAMDKASETIYALNPVSFRYHKEYDQTQTIAFGLIAEEVAEVNPDLVGRNPEGEPESVRYEQINAMLLNEFLKEHRKVQEQQATIAQLKSAYATQEAIITQLKSTDATQEATIALQQKQIEALTAGLQKVSAQVEMSRPATQMVVNNQ
jgi:uncharacterized coiled-coil protein SlyX